MRVSNPGSRLAASMEAGGVGSLQHPPTKRKLEMTVVKRSEIYWNIWNSSDFLWNLWSSQEVIPRYPNKILKDTPGRNLYQARGSRFLLIFSECFEPHLTHLVISVVAWDPERFQAEDEGSYSRKQSWSGSKKKTGWCFQHHWKY